MIVKPIDDFILAGFQQRLQQQFRCEVAYVTSADKARTLQRLRGDTPLEYPYMTLVHQAVSANTAGGYSANLMARRGLTATVDDDGSTARKVRLLPTNTELEVTYVTNKFKGTEQSSVLEFIRRWLFARRNGSLSFTVNYGLLKVGIQVECSESVPFSPRESATENITEYQVVTSVTIHGYMSEPELAEATIPKAVEVEVHTLLEAEGLSGGQFFPFV